MAVYDGFFDAYYNDETGEYDRAYGSGDFTEYFGQLIGSGVCVAKDPDSCKVSLSEGRALVHVGFLFIQGYWLRIEEEPYAIDLTGTAAQAVAATLNTGKKMIELEAIPAAESYPADTLVLAIVDPAAGTVQDTRYDTGICGVTDSLGGLAGKAAFAQDYIDNEVDGRLQQIEADIAAQETMLDAKIEEAQKYVEKVAPLPIGTIRFSANPNLGEEWLECDGRMVSKEDYPELVGHLLDIPGMDDSLAGFDFYWREPSLPSFEACWTSVTYGNGRFVVVGELYPSKTSNKAAYSIDGINWTETILPSSDFWTDVTYGDGLFVTIAGGHLNSTAQSASNRAAYSADGINWLNSSLPASVKWTSVTYGNGMFVAVAGSVNDTSVGSNYNGTNIAAYSINGKSWAKVTLPSSSNWSGVAYGNGRFVAVARDGDKAAYSLDGINWTNVTLPSSISLWSVTYGNGKFVAVAGSGKVAYSEDGINWTITKILSDGYLVNITYGNGLFVAVSDEKSNAMYSTDGINWVGATLPTSDPWTSVTYGNGKFVAIAGNRNTSKSSYADPFSNAKLPNLSLSNIPAYIKAKPTNSEEAST